MSVLKVLLKHKTASHHTYFVFYACGPYKIVQNNERLDKDVDDYAMMILEMKANQQEQQYVK